VDELGIAADGDDVGAHPLKALMLLCQSSEFRGSDEGEVRAEVPPPRLVRVQLEVRDLVPELEPIRSVGR
jgi:hypothetical protein